MKTQSWKIPLFLVILVAVSALPAFSFHTPQPLSIKISLPQESLDLSDLDVRDEFNRPVKDFTKAMALQQLFITQLNRMLLWNLTQPHQQMLKMLTEKWNVFAGVLKRSVNRLNEKLMAWLDGKKHRIKILIQPFSVQVAPLVEQWRSSTLSRTSFQFQILTLLSSTRLLL